MQLCSQPFRTSIWNDKRVNGAWEWGEGAYFEVASFSGCSHLQFLITKLRGKAWEIPLRQVDRGYIDRRGVVPDCFNLQTLHWSATNPLNNKLYWHCLLTVPVSNKVLLEIVCQPVCLPITTSHHIVHVIKFPRPFPSVLAYCKWSEQPGNEANFEGIALQFSNITHTHTHTHTHQKEDTKYYVQDQQVTRSTSHKCALQLRVHVTLLLRLVCDDASWLKV